MRPSSLPLTKGDLSGSKKLVRWEHFVNAVLAAVNVKTIWSNQTATNYGCLFIIICVQVTVYDLEPLTYGNGN